MAALLRVVAAAVRAGATARVSSATTLPDPVVEVLDGLDMVWSVEDDEQWLRGLPVTEAGRVEMLAFLKERAISVTAHRFGTPHDLLG